MLYEEFVKEYNDYTVGVQDIIKRCGEKRYSFYRKKALLKGDIKQRPFNLRFGKTLDSYKYYHYDKSRGKYRVRRVINGKYISYGFYDTEKDAQEVVRKLKECDWDKNILK